MTDNLPLVLLPDRANSKHATSRAEPCDCVRSGGDLTLVRVPVRSEELWRQAEVVATNLPGDHHLLFNPLHDAGPVVLNAPALAAWQRFNHPQPLDRAAAPDLASRFCEAGLLEPLTGLPQWQRSAPETLTSWLALTDACNLACDYCYVARHGRRMSLSTGKQAVDAVLRSARQGAFRRLVLKFAGGEPTLAPDLITGLYDYAVQAAGCCGVAVEGVILTNGVDLPDALVEAAARRSLTWAVSLDGLGSHHDAQRRAPGGGPTFERVAASLERLLAHGVRPAVTVTVTARNAAGLPQVVRYLLDRDLLFNLNLYRENACAGPIMDLRLEEEPIISELRECIDLLAARPSEASLRGPLLDRLHFRAPHERACAAGYSYLAVRPDGRIAACHMALEEPVTDIRVDDPLIELRNHTGGLQNLPVEQRGACAGCMWRFWCGGGCPLVTQETAGRYDASSPYCHIYRSVLPHWLQAEGLRMMRKAGIM